MGLGYDYYYLTSFEDTAKWAKDEGYNYCDGNYGFSIFHHVYWNILGK